MAASSRLLLRSHEAVSLQENASVLLQGSIHQRDGIFSPDSRGRQFLPCCLVLLVKAVQKRICTNKLNVNNMNEILFAGDKLYKYAKKNAKTYLKPILLQDWTHQSFISCSFNILMNTGTC